MVLKSLKPAFIRIPETVLKRRKRNLESEAKRVQNIRKIQNVFHLPLLLYLTNVFFFQLQERKAKRKEMVKRAEKYLKEYAAERKSLVFKRRLAKRNGGFFVEPEAKLAFVIRIRGLKDIRPNVKKALQLLRLRQIHNAVFVRINKASLNMLRLVEPWVAWGYPNLKSVRDLIYKRGYAKVNGQRQAITANHIIEDRLGKKANIICMEDLVHEIYTVGPHFKEANNFLWPFKLNTPKGGKSSIKKHFIEGGDYGNREEYINTLIKRML